MQQQIVKACLWGVATALYFRFGLEPTGWLFYEASHALNVESLYWGYSAFRGAGYAFSLWQYQSLACIFLGCLIALLIYRRGVSRRNRQLAEA